MQWLQRGHDLFPAEVAGKELPSINEQGLPHLPTVQVESETVYSPGDPQDIPSDFASQNSEAIARDDAEDR